MDRIGLPLRAEWIPVNELQVDHSYQRPLNTEHVASMRARYNPNAIGVFQVSDRLDAYFLMDGQHRKALVESMGMGDRKVFCAIYEDLSLLQEEELFIHFNEARLPVDALHTYRNKVRAYSLDAGIVDRQLTKHHLSLVPAGTNLGLRQISALNYLEDLARTERLETVLHVISTAWPTERGAYKRFYLELVARALKHYTPEQLITILTQLPPLELDRAALAHQDRPGVQLRSYLQVLEGYGE